jgi:hypothetical protein
MRRDGYWFTVLAFAAIRAYTRQIDTSVPFETDVLHRRRNFDLAAPLALLAKTGGKELSRLWARHIRNRRGSG